jgi:hypothetical protein
MVRAPEPTPDLCNCLALRQAARHVTQLYDRCLVPGGLRTTQFSILAKLKRLGPMTINALAPFRVPLNSDVGHWLKVRLGSKGPVRRMPPSVG